MILFRQKWNQITILMRGARKAMKEKECGSVRGSGLAVENIHAIGVYSFQMSARH